MEQTKQSTPLKVVYLSTALLFAGCQGLEDVNSTLGQINNALGAVTNGTAVGGIGGAYVDSKTQASVSRALQVAHPPANATSLFADAKPAIAKIIGLVACGAKSNQMSAYTAPGEPINFFIGAAEIMKYHQSGCVNVLRVNSIKKEAANAVKFSVDYQSPQSKENSRRHYTAIKQPSGEWLFEWRT